MAHESEKIEKNRVLLFFHPNLITKMSNPIEKIASYIVPILVRNFEKVELTEGGIHIMKNLNIYNIDEKEIIYIYESEEEQTDVSNFLIITMNENKYKFYIFLYMADENRLFNSIRYRLIDIKDISTIGGYVWWLVAASKCVLPHSLQDMFHSVTQTTMLWNELDDLHK